MVNVPHKMKGFLIIIQLCMLLLYFESVTATGYNYTPNPESDYLVNNWEDLPFKDQRGIESWSMNINNIYLPDRTWDTDFSDNINDNISFKCLSYAASTVNDWFNIQYGVPMEDYTSIIRGTQEQGTNPRELESQYQYRTEEWYDNRYAYTPWYSSIIGVYWGPITNERIPYRLRGYAHILSSPETDWINHADLKLDNSSEFNYTILQDYYNIGEYKDVPIDWEMFRGIDDINRLIYALEKYGPLLAYTEQPNKFINIHSMALVGYGEEGNGTKYFIAHDNYGESQPNDPDYSTYKKLYIEDIDQAFKFYPKFDWPTFHHDLRRTGFTLLEGDLDNEAAVKDHYIILDTNVEQDVYARPSIADIDSNDDLDVVVAASFEGVNDGKVYCIEENWRGKLKERWSYDTGTAINAPPMLADTYGSDDLEIFLGYKDGGVIALDSDGDLKWTYSLSSKYDPEAGLNYTGSVSNVVAYDLDLDGTNEIVFSDYRNSQQSQWSGELYVIDDSGNSYTFRDKENISNGGAYGAISVADIDNDDYPEIVVPTYYGIKVYNFSNNQLSLEWSNTHGLLEGGVLIYDTNRDNKYELLYTTSNFECDLGQSCQNTIYMIDPTNNGNVLFSGDYSTYGYSRVTPSIGDLDEDGNVSLVFTARLSSDPWTKNGRVASYKVERDNDINFEWIYPSGYTYLEDSVMSPSIADIDGDNDFEVLIGENENNEVHILKSDGTQDYVHEVEGLIGSSLAVGDFDGDKKAEIAVKRSGSPYVIMSILSDNNTMPTFDQEIYPITGIEGDLININESGKLKATDIDGDPLTFTYSSPFNASGYWQTDENSSGNYSVHIDVSDGNLSDYMYVDVIVFDNSTVFIGEFNDSSVNQSFNFSTPTQNFTKYVRIPKDLDVIYTELKYEGGSS